MGLPSGTFTWAGPFDREADPDWQAVQDGTLKERTYWDVRAQVFADLTGEPATMPAFFAHLFDGSPDEVTRPGARQLMADVKAAGIPLGLLTNDMHTFHDEAWIASMSPVLDEFDVIVDGRRDGVMKPDPAAFRLVCERMGVPTEGTVFVDDLRSNLEGAVAVGMVPVFVDVTRPELAFAETRRLLGL